MPAGARVEAPPRAPAREDGGTRPGLRRGSSARRAIYAAARGFDRLQAAWEHFLRQRTLGAVLAVAFLAALAAIEANRRGLLPAPVAARVARSHFAAISTAFTLLLVVEILELVFALARSVANAVGKQFELLSLILLREAFLEFGHFGEPIDWSHAAEPVRVVLADMAGALLVFVCVGVYYRLQHHQPITADETEQASFVATKKLISLALLVAFGVLGVVAVRDSVLAVPAAPFFQTFFTILIFSDVLLVLVSLAFTSSYHVVFRNSGFTAATVIIRLALTAPRYVAPLLGLGAALFVLALTAAYNVFAPGIAGRREPESPLVAPGAAPLVSAEAPPVA